MEPSKEELLPADEDVQQEAGEEVEEAEEEEEDPEILEMQRQVEELEKAAKELGGGGAAAGSAAPTSTLSKTYSPQGAATAASTSVDENSVHVGNLNEMVGPDDLHNHFKACGTIKRVTVLCDKWTGRPKGYAYIEFMEPKAVELALTFHETSLRGNTITVTMKRQNLPSFMLRGGRGRGGPGGFRGRGGRGGGYRGRGGYNGFRGRFAPY